MQNPYKRIKQLENANSVLVKNVLNKLRNIEVLNKDIETLHNTISSLEKDIANPAKVVEKMLGRKLKWKDTNKMNDAQRREYFLGAKQVLENETFKSVVDEATFDLVNDIAKNSEDFQQVLNRRFTLNGMQLIKERLESIPFTEEEIIDEEDLIEAI